MFQLVRGLQSILEACMPVKRGDSVLVIAYSEARSTWVGQMLANVVTEMGGEAILTIITQREMAGHEPPASVAAAMKSVNSVIQICERASIAHTNARKEATAAGVRYAHIFDVPLDDLKKGVSIPDIRQVKDRTEKLAERFTRAKIASLSTPFGARLTMEVHGREGISINPMGPVLFTLPYYAEAAIAPVEGTAEGMMVADLLMRGWGSLLREPVRYSVKKGRILEILGSSPEADRLRKVVTSDENAVNIAELGIGTSHVIPPEMLGTTRDFARMGTAHIGIGRNNDIGGNTWSHIHLDGLMSRPTLELDGKCIIKDGLWVE